MRARTIVVALALLVGTVVASGCALGTPGSATDLTAGGATLHADIGSNQGGDVLWWFRYGTTTDYDGTTPDRTLTFPSGHTSDDATVPVSEAITGLRASTTYHYEVCTSPGVQPGSRGCTPQDKTFTTPAADGPTLTVTPDSGLDPAGQQVTVEGTHWPAGLAYNLSEVVLADPRNVTSHGFSGVFPPPVDAQGTFRVAFDAQWAVPGDERGDDHCRAPYCSLQAAGPNQQPRLFAPMSFAAGTADVRAAQADAPDPVDVGQPVTYVVTVTNAGPDVAHEVFVHDRVQGVQATPTSATPSQGSCGAGVAPRTLTHCDLGTLAVGAQATVRFAFTPAATGTLTHLVTATARENEGGTATDNADVTESTSVVAPAG